MKTLYLIDGYAQFFRAFHAIRTPMTSPVTKEPTNATYGFVGMILKLMRECSPDYIAVAIDVSSDRGTFRSDIFPEYKANRSEIPDTLPVQIDRCIALLRALNIPVIGTERFEADDVIATISTNLKRDHKDVAIKIVSKDKDLAQLIEPGRVEMYDVHTGTPTTAGSLKETKGIAPGQVIDMLALMGDTADNIPGVPGIGAKTAAKLIQEYGTLDKLLADASNIKGKRGENIRASAELLATSRELVTLVHDVPIEFDLNDAEIGAFDLPALMPILKELGFNRYQQDLKAVVGKIAGTEPEANDAHGTLFAMGNEPSPFDNPAGEYTCVRTKAELAALVEQLKGSELIAFDTETTALSPMRAKLVGLSFAIAEEQAWYVPVRSPEPESHLDEETVLDALRTILEDDTLAKTGHNLKYDLLILRNHGIHLRGIGHDIAGASDLKKAGGVERAKDSGGAGATGFDSMIASFLIDASRSSHSMNNLALALLDHECIPISELIGTGKKQRTFDTVPLDRATIYAAEDADISMRLRNNLHPQLKVLQLDALFSRVELPLLEVLAELEYNGIRVNPDELNTQADRLNVRIKKLKAEIADASPRDFNPDSPKQLQTILFNATDAQDPGLGLKPIKKTKTGFSTDVEVLEKLAGDPATETPVPRLIVEYRQLTKLVSTYLTALHDAINPATGRVHASFHQAGAATGRLSSSDPNLQNIPIRTDVGREIRRAFIADDGNVLIGADYSQIELRVLAHLSQDENLIAAFVDGQDIHRAVAAQINNVEPDDVTPEQRNGAKMVNFGIVYGITPYGLARRLGIGNDEAAHIIDGYKARFPGINTFLKKCVEQARSLGYVSTMLGRRRPITEIDSNNPNRRNMSERVAINSVVQGSAADLIKLAMLDLHARLSPNAPHWRNDQPPEFEGVRMLLQIHDELVFECPEDISEAVRALVVDRMEAAMNLRVPLKVDSSISSNWYEGK